MSLLNLLYLEESQADTVIAAVHQWCAENECGISSDDGKKAMTVAVRLAKTTDYGGPDLLKALTQEMAGQQSSRVRPVLVLEDEPFIALDIELTLEKAGFEVKACSSRAEALQWLSDKTPSAAILDFRLRDGVCTEVASLLQTRSVPILFCSGADPSEVAATFRETSWVPKPFDDRQLTDLVRQAVEMRDFRHQPEEDRHDATR